MKDSHFWGSYGLFGSFYNVKDGKDLRERISKLKHFNDGRVPILVKTVKQYVGSGNRDYEYRELDGDPVWCIL